MNSTSSKTTANVQVKSSQKANKKCKNKKKKNKLKQSSKEVPQNSKRKTQKKVPVISETKAKSKKVPMMSAAKAKSKKLPSSATPSTSRKSRLSVPDSTSLASNWYWSNYRKALDWHGRHAAAHWKARAMALEEENKYLHHILQNRLPNVHHQVPVTGRGYQEGPSKMVHYNQFTGVHASSQNCNFSYSDNRSSISNKYVQNYTNVYDQQEEEEEEEEEAAAAEDEEEMEEDKDESDDIEFEMSEEMIKFFEQSFKHRMNLKKEKEEKEKQMETDEKVKDLQSLRLKRCSEMKCLYGDDASKIIGMETAVQLSFDKYCDTKSPKYWPNIPLRL